MQQGTLCFRALPTVCAFRSRPKTKTKSRKARAPGIASHKVAESVSLNGTGPHVIEEQAAVPATPAIVSPPSTARSPSYQINVIPHSRWPNGVPAVMGAHLMPSGAVAPISTSKGVGPPSSDFYKANWVPVCKICSASLMFYDVHKKSHLFFGLAVGASCARCVILLQSTQPGRTPMVQAYVALTYCRAFQAWHELELSLALQFPGL